MYDTYSIYDVRVHIDVVNSSLAFSTEFENYEVQRCVRDDEVVLVMFACSFL